MRMNKSQKNNININVLKEWFKDSSDIVLTTKTFKGINTTYSLEFIYCPNLVDTNFINDSILPRITETIWKDGDISIDRISTLVGVSTLKDFENINNEIEQRLFSGELVIFNDDSNDFYFIPISNPPKRSPEESNTETSIGGPRDGLVENISDNMALIRQRLKTSSLKNIAYTIGKRSKTKILLLYLDDIINPSILEEVQKRLGSLKIDILSSSNQLEELLYDYPNSIFPLMDYKGRPDFIVDSLNQGRFAILVDGNPSCLIGPTSLFQLLFSPSDAHNSFFYISFVRLLRIASLFTTIFLPGFYISLVTFQPEELPFTFLATVSRTRIGVPLPGNLEVYFMITMFELFKEAGVRLPKAIGQTVAVLGGLIIGDAAIRAGITSPSMLVVISLSVISGYTLINQNIAGNVVILRLFVLFLSSNLGLYGFFISFFFITTVAVSLESFGQPFVTVFALPNMSDLLKNFIKLPYILLKKRNLSYQPKDTTRKKE